MELKTFIKFNIREYFNKKNLLIENINYINNILDKINKHGKQSLSFDEITYLKQYNNNNTINPDLEKWLFNNDDNTLDVNGNKLLFDEFNDDEDIFYNQNKLIIIITKNLNKKPFTNNADWGGGYVWNIKSKDNFIGTFLYLGDDELIVLNRTLDNDQYQDNIIKNITNSKELYSFLLSLKK
jgi:hypothetical protein